AFFALLASWGRYAFFYRLIYDLPYVSTIRNPIKFMHPFHIAIVILAAFGMESIWRLYMRGRTTRTASLGDHLKNWWGKVSGLEKNWTIVSVIVLLAAVGGVVAYGTRQPHVVEYLVHYAFRIDRATQIAAFSVNEARWFAFWLAVTVAVMTLLI